MEAATVLILMQPRRVVSAVCAHPRPSRPSPPGASGVSWACQPFLLVAQRGNTRCCLGLALDPPCWDGRVLSPNPNLACIDDCSTFVAACINSNQPPSTRRSFLHATANLYHYQSTCSSIYVTSQHIPRLSDSDRHAGRCQDVCWKREPPPVCRQNIEQVAW